LVRTTLAVVGSVGLALVVVWTMLAARDTRTVVESEQPAAATRAAAELRKSVSSEQLAALLNRQNPREGYFAIQVTDLISGTTAHVDGAREFPSASLFKIPVMIEVIRQVRLGHISLDQRVHLTAAHRVQGSTVLTNRVGDRIEVRELLRLMIVESDNYAAAALIDTVRLPNIADTLHQMGFRNTRLLDWRLSSSYRDNGPYITSANDIGAMLTTIATDRLVDAAGSRMALDLLSQRQAQNLIEEGLPVSARVAHKWGEIDRARHDAGIVVTPRLRYVIVVLTEGSDTDSAGQFIRDVSRAVFTLFETGRAD
jgi:beta-lactamase class A